MVRARDRKSLEIMLEGIELAGNAMREDGSDFEVDKDLKIETSAKGDYRHRVVVSKSTFAVWVQHEILSYLTYPNFKSELAKFRGPEFTKAAHNVWDDMLGVSDGVQLYGAVGAKGARIQRSKGAGGYHGFTGSTFFSAEAEDGGIKGLGEVEADGSEHGLFEEEYAYKDDEADAEAGVLPEGSENWDDAKWEAWIAEHYGQAAVLEEPEPELNPAGAGSEVAIPAKKTRRNRRK